jgi:hypothetical protein
MKKITEKIIFAIKKRNRKNKNAKEKRKPASQTPYGIIVQPELVGKECDNKQTYTDGPNRDAYPLFRHPQILSFDLICLLPVLRQALEPVMDFIGHEQSF